jgi:hypothetical protein
MAVPGQNICNHNCHRTVGDRTVKHIAAISRVPALAETEVENETLRLIIDLASFVFELVGAIETVFTTVLSASLELKEALQQSG